MIRTLVGTPEQPRPRNVATWTNGTGTTATAGNVRIDWLRLDSTR